MSGIPFGFNPPDSPDDDPQGSGAGGQGGPSGFDMADLGAALSQLGSMLQGMGSNSAAPTTAVNWAQAEDIARKAVAGAGDPAIGAAEQQRVAEAVRLADLWIDAVTAMPSSGPSARAWSRSQWIVATMPAWQSVIEPVAEHVQSAMTSMMPDPEELKGSLPPELAAMLPANLGASDLAGMMAPMMGMARQMGANMFAMQVGQALSALAGEVVGAGDVGLPLASDGVPTLLPTNIAAFGSGLGIDAGEVELYLALREVAHQRLFRHVQWLGPRVIGAVEQYASGIGLDMGKLEELMRDVDPRDPNSISEALAAGVLVPEDTPAQKAALARLETLLALIEGWVDHLVTAAIDGRLTSATRLQEAVRRRRAAGGPAEKTFATLVGLELRPRRLREAAALWQALDDQLGAAGRDGVWEHPDLLPSADDLDDPAGFVAGMASGSGISDADLEALVAGDDTAAPDPSGGDQDAAGQQDPGDPDGPTR